MGSIPIISATLWPKQGDFLGKRCRVCFHYDTSVCVMGTIVRDDREEQDGCDEEDGLERLQPWSGEVSGHPASQRCATGVR